METLLFALRSMIRSGPFLTRKEIHMIHSLYSGTQFAVLTTRFGICVCYSPHARLAQRSLCCVFTQYLVRSSMIRCGVLAPNRCSQSVLALITLVTSTFPRRRQQSSSIHSSFKTAER